MIEPGDVCQIKNTDTEPITLGWDNVSYPIKPGETRIIPADAIINAFGDPRSTDNIRSVTGAKGEVGWVPDRASEVRRLRVKYANEVPESKYYEGREDHILAPSVEITTLTGERVVTVVDDPTGMTTNPAVVTQDHQATLEAIVKKQQAQLDALMQQVQHPSLVGSENDLPRDDTEAVSEPVPTTSVAANE